MNYHFYGEILDYLEFLVTFLSIVCLTLQSYPTYIINVKVYENVCMFASLSRKKYWTDLDENWHKD